MLVRKPDAASLLLVSCALSTHSAWVALPSDACTSLATAGFTSLPAIRELYPQPEHLELDPDFFASLKDKPLHLAFNIVSSGEPR